MAKVAVIGTGAIGGVVASLLAASRRHELTLCARSPITGLTVETPGGAIHVQAPILTRPEDGHAVDWVLIATKAYDAMGAAKWFASLCNEGAFVAVLQNGVEHRERFSPYVSPERIVPVVVDCPAERRSKAGSIATIVQRGPMSLKVPHSPSGAAFVDLFAGTPALAEEVEDWTTVAWRKLCHNSAGALSALALQPNGIMQGETMGEAALAIVRECVAVGRAEGADLSDRVPEDVLEATRRAAPDGVNSMLADRLAGRPMEIDARNGVIVRAGRKHGIPTPANLMAVALLQVAQANPL